MRDISEFIKEIKHSVTLRESEFYPKPVHYMGSTVLTNKEMKAMLGVYYDWYNDLPSNEKRKISDLAFDILRGIENG